MAAKLAPTYLPQPPSPAHVSGIPAASPIARGNGYREDAPVAALEPAVACLWSRGLPGAGDTAPRVIIPDNCADVILEVAPDGDLLDAYVVGTMSRPVAVAPRPVRYLGVRFRPGWLPAALGVHGASLRDARVSLGDVAPALLATLRDATPRRASSRLVQEAVGRLVQDAPPPPAVVQAALARIAADPNLRIERLCRELRVTRQHLARRFDEAIGLAPKRVSRVHRVQRALALSAGVARGHWARLAAELGYSDQSHLVADVRELAGQTPTGARLPVPFVQESAPASA